MSCDGGKMTLEEGLEWRMGVRVSETASSGWGGDLQGTADGFRMLRVVEYTDAYVDISTSFIAITFVHKTRYRLGVSA